MSDQDRRLGYIVLFFFLVLLAIGAAVIYQSLFSGTVMQVYVDDIGNLKKGDQVNFLGVPVGEVKTITRDPERNQAHLVIRLKKVPALYSGYQVVITDIGLFGSKEIRIFQGAGQSRADLTRPATGVYLPGIAEAIARANHLQETVGRLGFVVDSLLGKQSASSRNLVSQYHQLLRMADSSTLVLDQKVQAISRQVVDLETLVGGYAARASVTARDMRQALPAYSAQVLALSQSIDSLILMIDPLLSQGENTLQTTLQKKNAIGQVLLDQKTVQNLKRAVTSLNATLKRITQDGLKDIVNIDIF